MNEQEWLTATEPGPMMRLVGPTMADRKHRLGCAACCRTVWSSLFEVGRQSIEVSESYADGLVSSSDLGTAVGAAHRVRRKRNELDRGVYDAIRSGGHLSVVAKYVGWFVASTVAPRFPVMRDNFTYTTITCSIDECGTVSYGHREEGPPNSDGPNWDTAFAAFNARVSGLLRDIFGNPFRPVTFNPAWRTVTVTKLAIGIYEDRQLPSGLFDNQRMAILADALEEAGCDNADILGHLRGGGDHVRGCWVIDSILDKE